MTSIKVVEADQRSSMEEWGNRRERDVVRLGNIRCWRDSTFCGVEASTSARYDMAALLVSLLSLGFWMPSYILIESRHLRYLGIRPSR